MKNIKVLFIPHPMPSHLIPLISLAKRLNKAEFSTAFLLPEELHEYARNNNLPILNLHHSLENKLMPELTAISDFDPDVVVDDHNYYTGFSTRIMNKPRISIVRKGTIPSESLTGNSRHSSGVVEYFDSLKKMDLTSLGLWNPATISDLFTGDVNIIPSVPSLDSLPVNLENKEAYVYAGPLLLTDAEMAGSLSYSDELIAALHIFFEQNKDRKIIYFTKGIADPPEILKRAEYCIHSLLNNTSAAVITNIIIQNDYDKNRFFYRSFLPMNLICSKANLMIHQCGSGTCNYQLMYEIPGIILSSKCYDRDDIGIRLEKLGAACFILADLSDEEYYQKFDQSVRQLLDHSSLIRHNQIRSLGEIKKEILSTKDEFHFDEIIKGVIAHRGL
ncbi:MAG: hypothetical protein K2Q21_00060 [Chitinophagaceae bacterium]|nr:hypothetical protein [Chitinophagaceae bacterium]